MLLYFNCAFRVHVGPCFSSPCLYSFTLESFFFFVGFILLSPSLVLTFLSSSISLCRERRTVFSENVTLGARDTVSWRGCIPPAATRSEWLRTTTLAQGIIVVNYKIHKHLCSPNSHWSETMHVVVNSAEGARFSRADVPARVMMPGLNAFFLVSRKFKSEWTWTHLPVFFILHVTYVTVLYFILVCLFSVPVFTARKIFLQLLGWQGSREEVIEGIES